MNKQLIKIILFDIKSNLLSCLLLTFQMIVAFFVIGNLCSITAYKTVTVNALDGFDFPKNCYSPSSTDIYTDGGIVVDYDDIEKERNLSYYVPPPKTIKPRGVPNSVKKKTAQTIL